MEPCLNEPLNLCTKNPSRLSDVDACDSSPVHRTIVDYDEVCLASRVNDAKENCDKNSTATTTNGTSTPPSTADTEGTGSYDAFLRPCDGEIPNGTFDWQNKEKNPNLLLQQQYFLLHQHQQHQQQLMNNAPEGSVAKMHLDKYMKLTNRYLDTMSPFFQYFTPLMSQNHHAGQPSTSVQAAVTAAATLLLTSNLSQQHQQQNDDCETPPETPESNDGSGNNLLNQDSVRYFLHKLIEHNFLQQLQQQQQINDLINNNNHQNNNNNHNNNKGGYGSQKDKSPSSNESEGVDFYNHQLMSQQSSHQTKTFLDFLKNAAAAQSVSAMNQTAINRNQQNFGKRFGKFGKGKFVQFL